MRFALVDNVKREAVKGLKGICPSCGSDLTAKCGEIKLHHWAHSSANRNCDPWWENETDWHRAWKNHFPVESQEVILKDDQSGEKHIADVRTSHELVLEFQHSHLDPHERRTRENFYKHMLWVVDGTRLKRDYPRFKNGWENYVRRTREKGVFLTSSPKECFPSAWLGSSVPVVFDFKGLETINDPKDMRHYVYCLVPTNEPDAVVVVFTRESFIDTVKRGHWFSKPQDTQTSAATTPTMTPPVKPQRSSPYVFHRGRYVKRWRL